MLGRPRPAATKLLALSEVGLQLIRGCVSHNGVHGGDGYPPTDMHRVNAPVSTPPIGLKFGRNNEFQGALRRRVEEFFESTSRPRRDVPAMYLKTAILLLASAVFYLCLVFVAAAWWQAFPLAVLLGLTMAAIGFNIQHDGGHHAYSERPWINKLTALTLDLIGGSSYLWHYKHVVYHHTYVNITGHDTDIDLGMLARLTPHQKRYPFHRWQHLYIWPLYGVMAIKWHLYDDFKEMITGRIGEHRFPRPRGWALVTFVVGKLVFLALAFGIPMLFHSVWVVLFFYAVVAVSLGMVLSVVFQLAHAVEGAEFPMPQEGTEQIEHAWAVHQAETTVDFARRSRIAAWLLGGLNFQIEHHLLPRICHVNFPAMSRMVEDTCREFGVQFREHPSFRAGVASHYRWLRQMGKASDSESTSA
jgi:linoleoyl-CoA desaturase